ncbi:MAG: SDR family oxidoreductase [Chloroflexi bacterium CFX7]|nr:MAG: glucose 1-dehydrogenase [bacterium]MCE7929285.1 SDR family oxidoreductase [Chloroflexi bacterium CFX7]MCK6564565.1 glucose 1-dehydrogenase [Dehalococcoidia bacterium]MCL4230878.1 glucose 1-dehydrogenase [Dehalococcoidia bacterium]RIL04172.1 MAG: 2-hydroxycyclohexanecarboxyl-CoA dehydrogenase [bacterium]
MGLEGKTAIVTGGGSGIGRAICLRLAQDGARVAVADINVAAAHETVSLAGGAPGEAWAVECDITDLEAVRRLAGDLRQRWGRIDVLVNNAGWDRMEPFMQSGPETWDRVIAINLRGPINCFAAVLPAMVEQGSGSIVSISSDAGRVGSSGEAVYSACKAGIIGFSKTIAREVARHRIRVNVVCPGPTRTALLNEITGGETGAAIIDAMVRGVPFRRLGEPEDIAGAVAFFAGDDSAFCTGQVLSVSGGLTMAG